MLALIVHMFVFALAIVAGLLVVIPVIGLMTSYIINHPGETVFMVLLVLIAMMTWRTIREE